MIHWLNVLTAVICLSRYVAGDELALGELFGIGIIQGRVFSFGKNGGGQLGIGSIGSTTFSNEVHLIDEFGSGRIVAVSAGKDYAGAIDANGRVYMWGDGSDQLGLGDMISSRSVPTLVDSFGSGFIVSLVCGAFTAYAIDSNGALFGWGHNVYGELGAATNASSTSIPILISVQSKVIAVAGGSFHVCFITEEHILYCMGHGYNGALGNGEAIDRDTPTRVADVTQSSNFYTQIGCGVDFSCGLDTSGNVLCWGEGAGGRLGQGRGVLSRREVPTIVAANPWMEEEIEHISVGWAHSCVYIQKGHAWCFGIAGYNWIPENERELVEGWYADVPIPMKWGGTAEIDSIAIGTERTCVKENSFTIYCRGRDQVPLENEYDVLDFSRLDLPPPPPDITTATTTTLLDNNTATSTTSSAPSPTSIAALEITTRRSFDATGVKVVTSELRTTQRSIMQDVAVRTTADHSSNDGESDYANQDETLYIVLGATGGALFCVIAFIIVVFKVCSSGKLKRRAVGSRDGTKMTVHNKETIHSSRSGKSRSVSRSASRGKIGVAGGSHGKSRRSLNLGQGNVHMAAAHYGQILLNPPASNQYDTYSVQSVSTVGEYQRGDLNPVLNQYDAFQLSAAAAGDDYQHGDP